MRGHDPGHNPSMCGPSLCLWARHACARRGSGGAACRPVFAGAGSAEPAAAPPAQPQPSAEVPSAAPAASRSARGSDATGGDGTGSGACRSRGCRHSLQALRRCNPQGCQSRRSRRARSVLRREGKSLMGDGDGLLGEGASGAVRDRGGGDWGLDAAAFDLPPADALPRTRRTGRSPRSSSISPF